MVTAGTDDYHLSVQGYLFITFDHRGQGCICYLTEKKGCKNSNSQPERIYGLAVSAKQCNCGADGLLTKGTLF